MKVTLPKTKTKAQFDNKTPNSCLSLKAGMVKTKSVKPQNDGVGCSVLTIFDINIVVWMHK